MKQAIFLILSIGMLLALDAICEERPEPGTYDDFYLQASTAFSKGSNEEALALLQKAEQIKPLQVHTYNLRGAIYMREKKYSQAEASFQNALQIDPNPPMIYFNLGSVNFSWGRYEKAKSFFSTYLAKGDFDKKMANYMIFLCELQQGDRQKTDAFIATLSEKDDDPLWFYCKAAKEFHAKRMKQALTFIKQAHEKYSPEKNAPYGDPLCELGYLKGEFVGTAGQK